ncbi:MAG: sulfatase-like hydrolase/transferase, partial [Candidatus Binatia bacterium]
MLTRFRRSGGAVSATRLPDIKSAFWTAFWLAALLVAAKPFYLAEQSAAPPATAASFLASLAAISWQDVVFASAVGFLHRLARPIAGPLAPTLERSFAALYLLSGAYGLVNLKVFGFFLTPLTYPLLCLAGDWRGLITSIMPFLTISLLLAALLTVALAAAVVSASRRLAERTRPTRLRALQAAIVAAAAGWIVFGAHAERASWERRIDRRIAENPHGTFLASLAKSAAADTPLVLAERVRASDRDDFSTVAERDVKSVKSSLLRDASLGRARGWRGAHVENVIVLVLESVSARWLEIYGSPYPATPVLTRESKHALVFDNFYSPAGRSSDALAAILLSVQPRMSWR